MLGFTQIVHCSICLSDMDIRLMQGSLLKERILEAEHRIEVPNGIPKTPGHFDINGLPREVPEEGWGVEKNRPLGSLASCDLGSLFLYQPKWLLEGQITNLGQLYKEAMGTMHIVFPGAGLLDWQLEHPEHFPNEAKKDGLIVVYVGTVFRGSAPANTRQYLRLAKYSERLGRMTSTFAHLDSPVSQDWHLAAYA